MNLTQFLQQLKQNPAFMESVAAWHVQEARTARYQDFSERINPRLSQALQKRGISRLYCHQAQAVEAVLRGEDVTVVTPTASGKTMCYNLPVLNEILSHEHSRALYLFPTKALSADQVAELYDLVTLLECDIKCFTYDGDTSVSARKAVREAGHIVVTNPDMLHSGILPNHTNWVKLFENLRYIVIDELHIYRGVFGSHLANVLRRLQRICAFYGSNPQFICCSATIQNPGQLAQTLTGRPMTLIDDNGAPSGEKHFILYNPPVVNQQLGIRRSSLTEARNLAAQLTQNDIKTIVFTRSRLVVEVMVTYLRQLVRDTLGRADSVRGYRGGYLPSLRREIEHGLRSGRIQTVVSTNALELGIDIGQLEACVICGYPGTIASVWQQAGRAGRRNAVSAAFLVGTSGALDQYLMRYPEYFFGQSPESGLVNPDNLLIMISHFKCAAYELPFSDSETFAGDGDQQMLSFLQEQGILRHVNDRWHWMSEAFPASEISLRSASNENFLIVDRTGHDPKMIGEMDRYSVPMLLHEGAIYMQEGMQYIVEKLDFDNATAYIRRVEVDYYTDADLSVNLQVLDVFDEDTQSPTHRFYGEVSVSAIVTMFKKMKLDTQENLGFGSVDLPQTDMHTMAYWMALPEEISQGYDKAMLQECLVSIGNVVAQLAPVYLMCDPKDIALVAQIRSPFSDRPTIFLYDTHPGGTGFSEKLYQMHDQLIGQAAVLIEHCPCENGCPSCVGPQRDVNSTVKIQAWRLLRSMRHA